MAVTLESFVSASAGTDSLSFNVTVTQANSLLVLGLGNIGGVEMNPTFSTIRFDSVDMTHLLSKSQNSNTNTSVWYIYNPNVGTLSVTCGFTSAFDKCAVALVYTGTTSLPLTGTSYGDISATMTMTHSVPYDYSELVGFWTSNQNKTVSTNTTLIDDESFGGAPVKLSGSHNTSLVPVSSQSLEMTQSSSEWAGIILSIGPNMSGASMGGGVAYSGGASFSF